MQQVIYMLALLFGNGSLSTVEPRLTKLGIRFQHFNKDTIRDLNHESAELIYLLPFTILNELDWPQLRVRLWDPTLLRRLRPPHYPPDSSQEKRGRSLAR